MRRFAPDAGVAAAGSVSVRPATVSLARQKCRPHPMIDCSHSFHDGAPTPLRGLVFRHRNNGAGERTVGLSQLIQNREVIGVGDRYQVAWDMPLRPVGMVIAAARDPCPPPPRAPPHTQRPL